MTRKWSVAFTVLVVLLVLGGPAAAQAQNGCQGLSGSLAANLVPGVGWVGQGYLSIGEAAPVVTSVVDVSVPPGPVPNGQGIAGTEELTFTQPAPNPNDPAVGTIVMRVDFSGAPLQAPFLAKYHAAGKISGTGIYENGSGSVTIQGTALFDPIVMQNQPPRAWPFVWMAEIHGSICGLR